MRKYRREVSETSIQQWRGELLAIGESWEDGRIGEHPWQKRFHSPPHIHSQ